MRTTEHDMQTVLDAVKGEGQWASSGKLTSSAGNVAVVARRLNVHPETVRNYMKRWRTVADAVKAERRFLVEMAENKALEKIMDGDTAMIIFTLKAHPESDWSEKSRTEHTGQVVVVNWDESDSDSDQN